MRLYEDIACQNREEEARDECRVALGEALVPAKLSCLRFSRDLSVCRDPLDGESKNSCRKENQQLSECFQVRACEAMLWPVCSTPGRFLQSVAAFVLEVWRS